MLLFSIAIGFVTLGALLFDVLRERLDRATSISSCFPSRRRPTRQSPAPGPRSSRRSTSACSCILFTVPIGVGTAIYLEEYADKERWYNRLLEINIQNLAAVPSIVYGILGLAFLVRGVGLGRVLLAGALILTLLVLPTVIIASPRGDPCGPELDPAGRIRARRDASGR